MHQNAVSARASHAIHSIADRLFGAIRVIRCELGFVDVLLSVARADPSKGAWLLLSLPPLRPQA
jgi:hypothetical protein